MIYFCIPAHNEERTVGVVLWKLRQVMAELQRDYQIIVVDDASTDSTPAVLSPYIRVLPLTVIRNSQKRGYADSLEIALRESVRRSPYPKRDAVVVLQADFTEDPDVVPALMKKFEAGADVVASSVAMEPTATRAMRWGQRAFAWLLRRNEWTIFGDPMSGLRAYRVVTLKRAIDARTGGRLLTWQGKAANAELLALTAAVSRRTDVVETTLLQHRLQRDSRFSFMEALSHVRGVAKGKIGPAGALPTDSHVVAPMAIPVEPETREHRHRQHGGRGERPARGGRPARGERPGRGERPNRGERPAQSERPTRGAAPSRTDGRGEDRNRRPKPQRAAPAALVPDTEVVAPVAGEAGEVAEKKRRKRPRRRKKKPVDGAQLQLSVESGAPSGDAGEAAPTESSAPVAGEAPAKKKSRRGRRGGRGRRRGPKTDANNNMEGNSSDSDGGDASPPPMAAEGA